jgi:hypothetical protein
LTITFTKHAEINIKKRQISYDIIENVVSNPLYTEKDKYDDSLTHFIGKVQDKFLRIIGRRIKSDELLIISTFFDRRIIRKMKNV